MKKILSLLTLSLILISFWLVVQQSHADDTPPTTSADSWAITVVTTAEIPGANCEWPNYREDSDGNKIKNTATWNCKVEKGFGQITLMLGNMIKYFTFIAGLWGVLFIVINGILYSMGGIDSGWKDEAKKRITKTLIGLAILLLSWVILNAIAPWIYTI